MTELTIDYQYYMYDIRHPQHRLVTDFQCQHCGACRICGTSADVPQIRQAQHCENIHFMVVVIPAALCVHEWDNN